MGEQRRAFVMAYIRRKPPPRRRHHQRSTCELITAAKITSPAATVICSPSRQAAAWSLSAKARGANPFISHNALAKIIGSQNSIGMARSPCSAGKLYGIDGRRSETRHGLPLWRLQRGPHRCPPIQYSDFPHPRIHEVNGLLSAWFPTFVKRPAVCLRSNRPPAKRNTAHQRIIGRRRVPMRLFQTEPWRRPPPTPPWRRAEQPRAPTRGFSFAAVFRRPTSFRRRRSLRLRTRSHP